MKATKKQTRGKDEKSCIIQNLFMLKKNFKARNQIKVCRSIGSFKQIHVRPKLNFVKI